MKNYILVSIIIPVYNVETYLRECMDSVLNQSYENIEVLAIDDASQDNSIEILNSFNDDRLKIIKQTTNKGQAAARNLGLKKAKGDVIIFVDSDDYIELNTVEALVKSFVDYQVDMVRFNAKSFFDNDYTLFQESKYDFSKYLTEDKIYKNSKLDDIYLSYTAVPWLYAFKRDVLKRKHILFMEGIIHEDELFNTELYLIIESAVYINQAFYCRRYRENSTMTNQSIKQQNYSIDSYLKIIKKYEEIVNHYQRMKKNFIKYRINSVLYNLLKISKSNNKYKSKINSVIKNKLYYKKIYKHYMRYRKLFLVVKNNWFSIFYPN